MSKSIEILNQIDEKIKELEKLKYEVVGEDLEIERLQDVSERVKLKPNVPKYLTGNKALDEEMGGFSEGSFVNIAGENFSGKTTLVLEILKNLSEFKPVVFFSFEMYENLLIKNKFKNATPQQFKNLFIEQKRNDLISIESIIRTQAKKGIKFFAIDSRMKIKCDNSLQEYQKNSLISQTLSKLTQELGVIILLIQQISEADQRDGRLSFKGSGDIAYDSDVSLFVVKGKKDANDPTRALICIKDRINERTWKRDITDRSYQIKPVITTFESEKKIEIPLVS